MRLIELRLKNLNSLKGEWHIDFADAAFINEGIFAITGQTGAGKTTILDAICLALYGETPRINSISKSSNEVMTRQTAECFAEVVIDLNGSHYRCRWGQRRAYGKSDGNLQDATHEIAKLNLDPSKEADVLESKLSRTKDKIIELTRMDFQQFTRSILLAQGSFSAFLKAKADERADILEKITGTDIYATISEHVHEKKRFEEEILHKLNFGLEGLTLLNDDEETALSESLATNQMEQHKQQLALTQLIEQINWLDAVSVLQQKLITSNSELTAAMQAQQDFTPNAARLNTANKALELDGQYGKLTHHRDTVKNLTDEQQAIANSLPAQQTSLDELSGKVKNANNYAKTQAETLQITLPILAQVRALDNDIQQQNYSLADNNSRKDTLAANAQHLSQQITTHKQLQTDSQAELVGVATFLDTHDELNDIESDIATFENNCSRLKVLLQDNTSLAFERSSAIEQASHHQLDLDKLNAQQKADQSATVETRKQLNNLQKQQAELIAKRPLSQMRAEQEQIEQINNTIEQVSFKAQQIRELNQQSEKIKLTLPLLNKELTTITRFIKENELAINDAKDKRQDKRTHLNLLQQVASLEDYIVEIQDNQPCPLCGATEHPFAKHHPILESKNSDHAGNDAQSVTFQTQQQIKSLDEQIDNGQQILSMQQVDYATKKNTIEQQQQQLISLNEQIKTVTTTMQNIVASLFDLAKDNQESVYTNTISTIIEPLKEMVAYAENSNDAQYLLNEIKERLTQQRQQLKLTLVEYETIAESLNELSKVIENAEQQRFIQASAISEIETTIKLNQQQLTGFEHKISSNFSELQALDTSVLALINKYPANRYENYTDNLLDIAAQLHDFKNSLDAQTPFSDLDVEQHLRSLRQQRGFLLQLKSAFTTKKDEQQTLKTILSNVHTQIETKQVQLNAEENELNKLSQIVSDKTLVLKQLQQQRDEILKNIDNKNPDSEELRLRDLLDRAKTEQSTVQREYDKGAQLLAQLQQKQQQLETQSQSAMVTLDAQQSDFTLMLTRSQFDSEASYLSARLPIKTRNLLNAQQQQIDYALQQAQSSLKQTEQSLMEKQRQPLTADDRQTLTGKQQKAQADNKRLLETIGAISQRLTDNNEKKSHQQDKRKAITAQKDKLQVWQQLHKLIGSADGKKYRTFAQGLTFEVMIDHANAKLHKMSDRYLLIRDDNNALELNVIDNYQGGEIRSTKNLSGGEGFIISLALALGLSQMASHNIRVDSLFLDEGFGTLDEESLDIALDTLTSLQQEGKLIGVISHVAALKERILTQIQVTKLSGGFSQISGQGCQKIAY